MSYIIQNPPDCVMLLVMVLGLSVCCFGFCLFVLFGWLVDFFVVVVIGGSGC